MNATAYDFSADLIERVTERRATMRHGPPNGRGISRTIDFNAAYECDDVEIIAPMITMHA